MNAPRSSCLTALLLGAALVPISSIQAQGGRQSNPFAAPNAFLHYAPDRTCDLLHVNVDLDVDYPTRTFTGTVINTLSPLRNGVTEIMLNAGRVLTISSVKVDGVPAKYTHPEDKILITVAPTTKGKPIKIEISYSAKNTKAQPFGGRGGFHWIQTNNHVGFWTQGETESNSDWVPTWDYPNDLATSESKCTVQSDWDVIANGLLISTKASADGKKKTFHWKMPQPHATYLLSLCGGPFDIKKDKWEGIQLWYVVPKGEGYLIDNSFGDTKDMLTFFSKRLGVKYPWPKYAQNAMYDFGGGMENVSSTTLGEGSLSEERDGFRNMASLNSHELGHQWFGDLVTCKDWSDAWLNESFATYMQFMYFEHSRGADAYAWEVEDAMRSYFAESRRYQRPISTKFYTNGDNMFDSHTYPKGGVVLHSLRRKLGDDGFFAGLNYYLTKWRHTPVESAQLRRSFTEATGIDSEAFWAQWLEKPGHPVLDYTWKYEGGKVLLTVKQTQNLANGTPTYNLPTTVGLVSESGLKNIQITITKTEETFELTQSSSPKAVLLDPSHDYLREIPALHWSAEELPYILKFSPNAPDRWEAMRQLLASPNAASLQAVTQALAADKGLNPAFRTVPNVASLYLPELRAFWTMQLEHANYGRQAGAARALASLPEDAATTAKLRSLINDKAPIGVVVASINALAAWNPKANVDAFTKASAIKDRRGRIAAAAKTALDKAK